MIVSVFVKEDPIKGVATTFDALQLQQIGGQPQVIAAKRSVETYSLNMQPLLNHLREATSASHDRLDTAFGSLDLSERADYARFLAGHAIGMSALFPAFRTFVERDLGTPCPDYPAMLSSDLATLGIDAGDLPNVAVSDGLTPLATAYVLAGSRLGLAMIRRNGYWGKAQGHPSAYMEDERGQAIWKDVVARLKQSQLTEGDAAPERAGAIAAFDTFSEAFAASAPATAQ